jgi:hypothetical protein
VICNDATRMAELEAITETLKRQRQDLETQLAEGTTRGERATDLVNKIEALRRRADETNRRFPKPK